MNSRLNKYKYPGAKRLMLEAQELKDNTEDYCAQPIDDNLFEWHFTVRGPPDTAFDGGYYHGRLSFPTEYPMKPPSIILLTPNGRFETNKKICLSISGYHPETWQPSWSVRTALLALIAFMPTKANRAIGSLDFSDVERRKLAKRSRTWRCESCGLIKDLLVNPEDLKNAKVMKQDKAPVEPGTSRVQESETSSSSMNYANKNSSNNNNNNSDNDQSDSINNIEGSESKPTTDDSLLKQSADRPDDDDGSSSRNSSQESANGRILEQQQQQQQQQQQNSSGEQNIHHNMVELRRTRFLKSIFILLSLLILRRVVMVIQA